MLAKFRLCKIPNVVDHVMTSGIVAKKPVRVEEAVERIAAFMRPGNVVVLTGAGVSVDSGLQAYRGRDGLYATNPKFRPTFYRDLFDDSSRGDEIRKKYWLNSYLSYPYFRDAQPNTTHLALAALQRNGHIPSLITQNVDGLHLKAACSSSDETSSRVGKDIVELHGTLHKVRCLIGHSVDRWTFQDRISIVNPELALHVSGLERAGLLPRSGVVVGKMQDFVIPECPNCLKEGRRGSIQKADVVHFGDSIPQDVKRRSLQAIQQAERLLVVGTTLTTPFARGLVDHALKLHKPVVMINVGPTNADREPKIEKIELFSGRVLPDVTRKLLANAQESF